MSWAEALSQWGICFGCKVFISTKQSGKKRWDREKTGLVILQGPALSGSRLCKWKLFPFLPHSSFSRSKAHAVHSVSLTPTGLFHPLSMRSLTPLHLCLTWRKNSEEKGNYAAGGGGVLYGIEGVTESDGGWVKGDERERSRYPVWDNVGWKGGKRGQYSST